MPMRSGGDTATVLQQIKTASETASRKQTDNGLTEKKETDIRLHQEKTEQDLVLDLAPSNRTLSQTQKLRQLANQVK